VLVFTSKHLTFLTHFILRILISATYILAPLKSRIQRELGTSHAEFGALFSAYSLNSTWTPLVAGLLVSRLGTTVASILATCTIFLGR